MMQPDLCSFCGTRPKKKGNLTCGDKKCSTQSARATRGDNWDKTNVAMYRELYGDENPWTQWLRDAVSKRA